ncbi:MAG: hypothetical protein WCL39_03675 [Armatimonadota bacterium]
MNLLPVIRDLVERTLIVDTHEHIVEVATYLNDLGLVTFGERDRLFSPKVDPSEKWQIVAPYWDLRHTGYGLATRIAVQKLYDEEICASRIGRLNDKYLARQGLSQALSELVDEGWLSLEEALDLVLRLMHRNAERLFPMLQSATEPGVIA